MTAMMKASRSLVTLPRFIPARVWDFHYQSSRVERWVRLSFSLRLARPAAEIKSFNALQLGLHWLD
jgi:hypothetical protein